jgi:hypothetical protein
MTGSHVACSSCITKAKSSGRASTPPVINLITLQINSIKLQNICAQPAPWYYQPKFSHCLSYLNCEPTDVTPVTYTLPVVGVIGRESESERPKSGETIPDPDMWAVRTVVAEAAQTAPSAHAGERAAEGTAKDV